MQLELVYKNKLLMYLLIILGFLNRLRGTWGWWAKVNAAIYAAIVYYVYNDRMMLNKTYDVAVYILDCVNYALELLLDVTIGVPDRAMFSVVVVTALAFLGYVIGEMSGWGLWVGTLVAKFRDTWYLHTEREGGWYTGIQRLAEYLIPPTKENWIEHCRVALTLRGIWWASWMMIPLALVGLSINLLVLATLLLGVMFPYACDIGELLARNGNELHSKYLNAGCVDGWEWQEFVTGTIQIIVYTLIMLS